MARTHGRGGAGIRKTNKKGATKGSGGQRRKGLAGKGPTPKAEDRIYHAKHKAKLERERRNSGRHQKETAEMVVGRNPVIECLHAKVPATTLYIVAGTRNDKRLSEAVAMCNTRNIPIIEVQRHEMDRMTGNGMHQGIGLQIPPYKYADVDELIARAVARGEIRPGQIDGRLAQLPVDLLRHDVLFAMGPLADEAIEEIVDAVFLPLVRLRAQGGASSC